MPAACWASAHAIVKNFLMTRANNRSKVRAGKEGLSRPENPKRMVPEGHKSIKNFLSVRWFGLMSFATEYLQVIDSVLDFHSILPLPIYFLDSQKVTSLIRDSISLFLK